MTKPLITALPEPNAEGTFYAVDMRMRPSGQKGPMPTKLKSFIEYQTVEAWTWEHMAMTRARVIAGDAPLCHRVEQAIANILKAPRDRAKIAADVRDMRARIAAEKGTAKIWDMKQVRDGLVDLEFIAQHLQLVAAHAHPGVLDQNTLAAIAKLASAGEIDAAAAECLTKAGRLVHALTQIARLCLVHPFDPDHAPEGLKALLARAAGLATFEDVEAALRSALEGVHRDFDRLIA